VAAAPRPGGGPQACRPAGAGRYSAPSQGHQAACHFDEGNLAAGVSTSGYPWKYPGRVSDSALIGAGNYCDNRTGAAACTGRGELAIRGGTARSVLLRLAAGDELARACAAALAETADLPDEFRTPLQCLCLTPDGRHGGASTNAGATYAVMTAQDEDYRVLERRRA
jgi:isoaspartyl peptidase/L-asparaginase-like protein (Ntn-hydrolase superfamily)